MKGRQGRLAALAALLPVSTAWGQEPATLQEVRQSLGELKSQVEAMSESQQGSSADVLGLKRLKVTGYLQARYESHADRPADAVVPPAAADKQDSFSIRRGRIKFTYAANPTSQFVLYPDMSTKDGVTLKEAYVKLTEPWSGRGINLIMGQQNWFFGREIERTSSAREFPERARVFGKTVFDGERDKGARVEVPDLPVEGLNVKLGLFNGNGIKPPQTFDNDKFKLWMGRVAYSLGWLDLGISQEYDRRFATRADGSAGTVLKKHAGADAFLYYELPVLGGGSFGGEYMLGQGVQNPAARQTRNEGWFLAEVQNLGGSFQAAARYDVFDADRDAGGDVIRTTTLAAHYFWDDNVRITLAWENPVTEDPGEVRDNTTTLQVQYKF
ncbi:MAG: hypothetical protein HY552_02315 [Elusimicrobia bacterium]|nr:hypothetical protein [Elusimicrobiota bacterium]